MHSLIPFSYLEFTFLNKDFEELHFQTNKFVFRWQPEEFLKLLKGPSYIMIHFTWTHQAHQAQDVHLAPQRGQGDKNTVTS